MRKYWEISVPIWGMLLLLLFFSNVHGQNKDSILQLFPSKTSKERMNLVYEVLDDIGNADPEKALYYHKKLMALSRKLNDKALEAVVSVETGYAIYMMGNTVEGTELQLKALEMAEKTGNQQAIGIAYSNIAQFNTDRQKQIELAKKALIASTAANDILYMCFGLGALSEYYARDKQSDSAMYYAQQALTLATTHNIQLVRPLSLLRVGWLNYYQGQKAIALEYFQAAKRDPFTATRMFMTGSVYGAFYNYYRLEGNTDSALHYAQTLYQFSSNSYYALRIQATNALWRAYEKANKTDSAFKYMKLHAVMKDSMYSIQKQQQVQARFLIEEQKQFAAEEERKHNIQYSAIALGLAIFLVVFLVLSHSVIVNQRLIRFLGVLSLLIVFEFINLLIHPYVGDFTHHSPLLMLCFMVCIAALLIPLHHKLEHWIKHRLVEKNNKIRLAAAKKTIAQLEGEKMP